MSRIDLAKSIFNSGTTSTQTQQIPQYQNPGITDIENNTSVRYGSVIADRGNNNYEIKLAGSETSITVYCETTLAVGQGVRVVFQNGAYLVYGLSNEFNKIEDKFADRIQAENNLSQQITDKGNEIINQANKDLANATKTLNSRIDKTDAAITTEVSERKEAVNGAVSESKSYTDTKATEIQSTVEQNITNSLGQTYATKSEVTQSANGLRVELNKSIDEAKTAADNANTNATQAKTDAANANSNATQAKKDAANAKTEAANANANATQANTNATEANANATQAKKDAANAKTEAAGAKTDATQAKADAANATTAAGNANATATQAKTDAAQAKKDAANANTNATQAKTDAANANAAASNAAKTATDFLEYTSSGLKIGKLTGSSLGTNAVLSTSNLKFNYNTTNLATFASNYIALGGSSNRSDIYFAGDKSNAKSKIIGGYQGLGVYGQGTVQLSSGSQLASIVDVASLGAHNGNFADLDLTSSNKQATLSVGSGSSSGDITSASLELYGDIAYLRGNSEVKLIAPKITAGSDGVRIDVAGSVCRTISIDWTLPKTDTVVPFNSTQTIYNPCGLISVGTGYIKVDCPSNYNTIYVELSANLTADATVDNTNLAVAIMKSTSSTTNPTSLDNVVSAISGTRTALLHIGIAPVTVAITSNTYFRIVARIGGGGKGFFSGSQAYRPTFNVRIVGAF